MKLARVGLVASSAVAMFGIGVSPAFAETNTALVIQEAADTATRPTGVCLTYGTPVTIATVYNPVSPANKLVTVAVPVITSVKAC